MLVIAILIICLAHVIRVFRWELLIGTYEKPNGIRLTKSLALGYFLNYFLPFRVGDLARAVYAGRRMQNGRGFALATVIVERCLDVIVVGVMFIAFAIIGIGNTATDGTVNADGLVGNAQSVDNINMLDILGTNSGYYIILGVGVLAGLLVVYALRKYIKRLIYLVCGLLNEKYEEKLLRFFWALIWGFKDIISRLPKVKLAVYTVLMWGLYLCSYSAFSVFLEESGVSRSFRDVFFSLFDQTSLLSSGLSNGFSFGSETGWYALFLLVPSIMLLFIAILWDRFVGYNEPRENLSTNNDASVSTYRSAEHLNLIPQTNTDERRTFLKMYFAGEKKEYIENYLKINRNILVLRDYSAGSNATTILCTDGEQSFYRKYAFQGVAKKLSDQIDWLKAHERAIPVADIIREDISDGVCFYDMPYYSDAITLFEYTQAGEKEKAWEVIESVLGILEERLYTNFKSVKDEKSVDVCQNTGDGGQGSEADNSVARLEEYVAEKATKNLDRILNDRGISELLKYESVIINGKEYSNLNKYVDLLIGEKLIEIFKNDKISEIHGDLTIENIICKRDDPDFYLIDPNTGNIFDSKFIDYAKLLQSLHGKYEFLMAVDDVAVNGNRIDFKYVESDAYSYLYDKYKVYLEEKFSREEVKSIYYHEIINWLRLMPYKLEKGRGVLFYAGLIKILNEIQEIS